MKKRIICGILVVFLGIALFIVTFLNQEKKILIPVVNGTILATTKITAADISYLEVDASFLEENIYLDSSIIIQLYTDRSVTLVPNMFFYKELLIDEQQYLTYTEALIKEDEVIYPVIVDSTMINDVSFINQYVDVYATIQRKDGIPITDCILQSVRIVGIKDRNGLDITDERSNKIVNIVLLAIKEEHISYLKDSSLLGSIQLYYQSNPDNVTRLVSDSKVIEYLNELY